MIRPDQREVDHGQILEIVRGFAARRIQEEAKDAKMLDVANAKITRIMRAIETLLRRDDMGRTTAPQADCRRAGQSRPAAGRVARKTSSSPLERRQTALRRRRLAYRDARLGGRSKERAPGGLWQMVRRSDWRQRAPKGFAGSRTGFNGVPMTWDASLCWRRPIVASRSQIGSRALISRMIAYENADTGKSSEKIAAWIV